jgi:uncharacterized protein
MSGSKMNKNATNYSSVLITGGSGLIGKYLTTSLLEKGYRVSLLSRKAAKGENVISFLWDPEKNIVDTDAFKDVDFIVHLAGANIGEERWTEKRKEEILDSRVHSAGFLFETVQKLGINLKGYISASASGIYGSVTSERIFSEADPPAGDFLGTVCKSWEESADLFAKAGIRTVKIRTAVVLERSDSALSKLMMPAKFGFLVQTGSGKQYMPWIHINDLINIYVKAIEDPLMSEAYNAVAPQHVTHKEFMKVLGAKMKKPVFPVPVPEFVLRTFLGEMSDVVLKGSRISDRKIISSGYNFNFGTLEDALDQILIRVSK